MINKEYLKCPYCKHQNTDEIVDKKDEYMKCSKCGGYFSAYIIKIFRKKSTDQKSGKKDQQ